MAKRIQQPREVAGVARIAEPLPGRRHKMGTFRVGCRVENIGDRSRSAQVEKLLVDTGSDYTWIPSKVLQQVGINPEKQVSLTMANGRDVTRRVGFGLLRVDKFFTVDEIVFAEADDLLLLGARALEGFNARVDPKLKKLVPAGPALAAGGSDA